MPLAVFADAELSIVYIIVKVQQLLLIILMYTVGH